MDLIRIGAFPVDIGLQGGGPGLVDFDEDGSCEAFERGLVWEDAYFLCAALELLLDRAFDRIGCAHSAPVFLWQFEHGEALRRGHFEPGCEFRRVLLITADQSFQCRLGRFQGWRIPDVAQLFADDLAHTEIRCVVDGVLRQMELAALPAGAGQYGFARRFELFANFGDGVKG